MMWTKLHWVDGPWPGKLAVAARPRGGEWLTDEVEQWQRQGVGTVFSLLTPEEEIDLDLAGEGAAVKANGMKFGSFPIADRQVPVSEIGLVPETAEQRHWIDQFAKASAAAPQHG